MMMMAPSVVQQQDTAGVKPPDEGGMQLNPAAARLASERKQKAAGGAGQASAEGGGGSGPTAAQKCPRCDSLNTKFCYYNNYSLSQPRHFCKNCRRYWTKGGALRNVPIGGGCRKNKRINHINPAGGSPGHSPSGKPNIGQGHHQLRAGFEPLGSSGLASLDASSLLASMGPPPGLFSGGPSTSSFMNPPDVHHHPHPHHHLGLTFSRLQESLRMADHPGASAAPSTMFSLSPANHLLNLGSNSPGLQLPPSFDPAPSFPTLNYPTNTTSSAGKLADQSTTPSLLFNHGGAADFSPFFESVSSTSAPIIPPVLEDHLSTFNSSNNSSSSNINMAPDQDAANNNSAQNSNNLRQQLHPNSLALQMLNDGGPGGQQGADDGHADHHHHHHHHHHEHHQHQHQNNDNNNAITRGHTMLPGFEEETPESNMLRNIRGMKGKSMLSSAGAANSAPAAAAADIRALPLVDQWQGMTDSLFTPPPADNSLWNVSWPEMHAALAAGSTAAGAMLH